MKTVLITTLLLIATSAANAQQWCTEQYNPKYGLIGDPADSPDYGKQYTMYFYGTAKSISEDIRGVTKIYKVTFTNYDGDKLMPSREIAQPLKKDIGEWLKNNYTNEKSFRGHSFGDVYISYCLNLSDLQENYQKLLDDAKKKNLKTVVFKSLKPKPVTYTPSAMGVGEQTVTFDETE